MKVDEIVEKEVRLPLASFSARHAFLFIAKKDVRERESFLYSCKADSNIFFCSKGFGRTILQRLKCIFQINVLMLILTIRKHVSYAIS